MSVTTAISLAAVVARSVPAVLASDKVWAWTANPEALKSAVGSVLVTNPPELVRLERKKGDVRAQVSISRPGTTASLSKRNEIPTDVDEAVDPEKLRDLCALMVQGVPSDLTEEIAKRWIGNRSELSRRFETALSERPPDPPRTMRPIVQ